MYGMRNVPDEFAVPRLQVDPSTGRITGARRVDSPNCDERPAGTAIELIVVHGISLPPGEFGGPWIDALFTNTLPADGHEFFASVQALRVSSHALIRRTGEIVQYVGLNRRAWHAGQSHWKGRSNCNDFSVGIELEATDTTAYETAQYVVLSRLIAATRRAYPTIAPENIVGHSDVAPGRKTDPGVAFDWRLLRALIRFELEVAPR